MKIKSEIKQDLLLIVDETKELLLILSDMDILRNDNLGASYDKLDMLLSNLKVDLSEYNQILIEIANEVRKLLIFLSKMGFNKIEIGIGNIKLYNQYWKLKDMIRWFDWILSYYDELKTLPPKYDYKPKQVYDV